LFYKITLSVQYAVCHCQSIVLCVVLHGSTLATDFTHYHSRIHISANFLQILNLRIRACMRWFNKLCRSCHFLYSTSVNFIQRETRKM